MAELHIDPDLEGVLRDVARNPRATLLRVAKPAAFRAAFESATAVSEHATGLITAERELLRAHRAELAFLLRQACVARLCAHPGAKARTIRHVAPNVSIEPVEPRVWRERARCSLAAAREDVDDLSGIELVERLVCGNGEFDANAAELALASMKLWPSDRARMNVGVQYMFDSVYELALTTFHELVERRPPAWLVAVAWTNIGFVYESTGRSGEALSAYVTAGRFDETRFMPPMAAFATALQLGNRRAAAGAAHLVEERTREEPVAVDEFIAMQRARPRDIERAMVIIRTLDSIEGRLGPATEAIGRAML